MRKFVLFLLIIAGFWSLPGYASAGGSDHILVKVKVNGDSTPPAAPVIISPVSSQIFNSSQDADAAAAGFQICVAGTAEAGSTVTVNRSSGGVLATATADQNGAFAAVATLSDGMVFFYATAKDSSGNTSDPSETIGISVDTIPAPAPVITAPVDNSTTGEQTVTVTGTATFETATVFIYLNSSLVATITPVSGNWTAQAIQVKPGVNTIYATCKDVSGNISASGSPVTVSYDNSSSPMLLSVSFKDSAGLDNAFSPNGDGTQDTGTLTFTSNKNGSATVIIDTNRDFIFDAATDRNATVSVTSSVPAEFVWDGADRSGAALPDGTYRIQVIAKDSSNRSSQALVVNAIVDTSGPGISITSPVNNKTVSGTDDENSGTSGIQLSVKGAATSTEANAVVSLTVNTTAYGSATALGDGSYIFSNISLVPGANTISVIAADKEGNSGLATTHTLTVNSGTLKGKVTASVNGAIISGAMINAGGAIAYTDDRGEYTVAAALGNLQITVGKPGYNISTSNLTIQAGVNQLNCVLTPATYVNVSGTVKLSTTNAVLTGAIVTCTPAQVLASDSNQVKAGTDGSGIYSITRLPVGTYTVTAEYPQTQTYTATITFSQDTTTADLVLSPVLNYASVSGTVKNLATSAAISAAVVKIGTFTATTASNGSFSISNIPFGIGYEQNLAIEITASNYQKHTGTITLAAGSQNLGTLYLVPVSSGIELESNNSFSQANLLSFDKLTSAHFAPEGDMDYYKFRCGSPGSLTVELSGVSPDIMPVVELYDSNHNALTLQQGEGSTLTFNGEILAGGDYYICAYDPMAMSPSSAYAVKLTFTASGDAYEPNNSISQASQIALNCSIHGSLFKDIDSDYFKITAGNAGMLNISVTAQIEGMAPTLTVLNSASNELMPLSANTTDNLITLDLQLAQAGTYYIFLSPAPGSMSTLPYTLATTFTAANDFNEPNNDFNHATPITGAATIRGAIFPADELDYYKLHLDTAGSLTLTLTGVPSGITGNIVVYNSSHATLAAYNAVQSGTDVTGTLDIAQGGDYFIVVDGGPMGQSLSAYTLTSSFNPSFDIYEPNNDFAEAAAISIGTTIQAVIFPEADSDFFKFSVNSPGKLTVHLTNVPASMLPALSVHNSSHISIGYQAGENPGQNLTAEFTLPAAGEYYINAHNGLPGSPGTTANYTFTTAFISNSDTHEPNNTFAQATAISLDTLVQGAIDPVSDLDYYSVQVTAEGTLTVHLTNIPSTITGDIMLCDSTYKCIASTAATGKGIDVTLLGTVPQAGTYYLVISDVSQEPGTSSSSYTLQASFAAAGDSWEPNNNFTQAKAISFSTPVQATIFPEFDPDYFKINAASAGILTIQTTHVPQDLDISFSVYTAANQLLSSQGGFGPGNSASLTCELPTAGAYYIMVTDFSSNSSTASYSFQASMTSSFTDQYEPNNTMAQAAPITLGNTLQGTIFPQADTDYFKIHVDAASAVYFELTNIPQAISPALQIYSSSGSFVKSYQAQNASDIRETCQLGAGDYFVAVCDLEGNNSSLQPYTLKITGSAVWIRELQQTSEYISPNGDGILENMTINAQLSEPGSWQLAIKNSQGTVVRQFSGTAGGDDNNLNPFLQFWDGKDSGGSLVPDDAYTFYLSATARGISSLTLSGKIVVDTVPPATTISSPAAGARIAGQVTVQGTASDANFQSYTFGYYQGSEIIALTTGSNPVVNSALGSFMTKDFANGTWNFNLTTSDKAGNQSTTSLSLVIDNIQITNISIVPQSFMPAQGQTTAINYTLDRDAAITLKIYDRESTLVKELISGVSRSAGSHSEVWDGKNAAGALLPSDYYTITIDADSGKGWYESLHDPSKDPPDRVTVPSSFNPYKSEPCKIQFSLPSPCFVSIGAGQYVNYNAYVWLLMDKAYPAGNHEFSWDGRISGAFADYGTGQYPLVLVFTNSPLPDNSIIITAPQQPSIPINSDSYAIIPNYGDLTTVTYTLPASGIACVYIYSNAGLLVKTLVDHVSQSAGTHTIDWSGTDNDGKVVYGEGDYLVKVELNANGVISSGSGNITTGIFKRFRSDPTTISIF